MVINNQRNQAYNLRCRKRLTLNQNYPNQFNPNTTISFTHSSKLYASLKVVDCIGREVASLVSRALSAGTHSALWNAEDMPSRVYFYRFKTDEFTKTKKLVLLR